MKRRRGRRVSYADPKSELVQTIARMSRNRATLREIGETLKPRISPQGVHNLKRGIAELHGENLLRPTEPVWAMKEAAAEIGVSICRIRKLCTAGEVDACRRNRWLISEKGMKALRVHPYVTGRKRCIVCRNRFTDESRTLSRQICSLECKRRRSREQMKQKASPESLKGWLAVLWWELHKAGSPRNGGWVGRNEAVRRFGLTDMQVSHLGNKGLVRTRSRRKKHYCHGTPLLLYAASDLRVAGRVFRTFQIRNGGGSR